MATIYKKPKYYFGNYLQKAQILFWHLLSKNPKLLGKQLFYLNPNIIWQKNYIMLKAQNYFLAKTFFDCERSRKLPLKKRDFWSAF